MGRSRKAKAPPTPKPKKLRLLKLLVMPVLVADDGDSLEEVVVERPMIVMADDVKAFPARIKRELARQEKLLNGQEDDGAAPVS